MTKELTGGSRLFDPVYWLKNVLVSYLATLALLFGCAAAASCLAIPALATEIMVTAATALCILWGGFRAARHLGRQGLLCGAVSGLVYMALLSLLGMLILGGAAFSPARLVSIVLGAVCGALGGVIGVNTKTKRR